MGLVSVICWNTSIDDRDLIRYVSPILLIGSFLFYLCKDITITWSRLAKLSLKIILVIVGLWILVFGGLYLYDKCKGQNKEQYSEKDVSSYTALDLPDKYPQKQKKITKVKLDLTGIPLGPATIDKK